MIIWINKKRYDAILTALSYTFEVEIKALPDSIAVILNDNKSRHDVVYSP
jgi:hypothetical protein